MSIDNLSRRARVCRALLSAAMPRHLVDSLWTRTGPTALCCELLQGGWTALPVEHHTALNMVWNVWGAADGAFTFDLSAAIRTWGSEAWEVLETFCSALADDAAAREDGEIRDEETALDAWVRAIETRHRWRKVDQESDHPLRDVLKKHGHED